MFYRCDLNRWRDAGTTVQHPTGVHRFCKLGPGVTLEDSLTAQEEHHRVKTFQEEYLEFLVKAGIEFDEKYLW